ncbi:hypothetical protein HMPREF0591_4374 [Mycobacterium parascrofulaceum ATCC BAA-614]|uniref:Uncharacterized protein n=2 Tax=Mycobacterium parascrofulaceum TaxID=240125 RepID=D5PDY0_9MYCO|nr:hypothetical protein HMPREF0591_4374 [Mycobacterium parascrofulaceum ATCC BAA-614]
MTDPQSFQTASEEQHADGVKLIDTAEGLRRQAGGVAAEQSGQAIDGFFVMHFAPAGQRSDNTSAAA